MQTIISKLRLKLHKIYCRLFPFIILIVLVNIVGTTHYAECKEYSPAVLALLHEGDSFMEADKPASARSFYEKAIELEPACPEAHNQLGLCYLRQNMLFEASGEFKKAIQISPNFLHSLNNLAIIMYRQNNYDEAIIYYKRALAITDNKDHKLLTNLASVFRDKATFFDSGNQKDSDFYTALDFYRRAIALKGNYAPAYNNLGLCLLRLRRYQEAEDAVKTAIKLKPDYALAYFALGLIQQARNKLPEALAAYQNSLRYESVRAYAEGTRRKIKELGIPVPVTDHFAQGYDHLMHGEWQVAACEFKIAGNLNTKALPATTKAAIWNNLGYALTQQKKYKEAIAAYKKANAFFPSPTAQYNLGQVLRLTGNYMEAEKAFKKSLDEAQGIHALAHNALGIILKIKGNKDKAIAHYKLAIAQSGDTLPVVHYNLGLLFEKYKMYQEAAREFSAYIAAAPEGINSRNAQLHLLKPELNLR